METASPLLLKYIRFQKSYIRKNPTAAAGKTAGALQFQNSRKCNKLMKPSDK